MEKIRQSVLILGSIICLIVVSFSSSGALCIENDTPTTPIVTGMENVRDVIPFPRYPSHAEF